MQCLSKVSVVLCLCNYTLKGPFGNIQSNLKERRILRIKNVLLNNLLLFKFKTPDHRLGPLGVKNEMYS